MSRSFTTAGFEEKILTKGKPGKSGQNLINTKSLVTAKDDDLARTPYGEIERKQASADLGRFIGKANEIEEKKGSLADEVAEKEEEEYQEDLLKKTARKAGKEEA